MILIIGHDASLTGAPKVLLNFIKWLVVYKKIEVRVILKNGGPLLNKYKALASVSVWETKLYEKSFFYRILNNFFDLPGKKKIRIIKNVLKPRPDIIISNTIVNGDILEFFVNKSIPVVNWVHELESVINQFNYSGIATKSLKYSNCFIAASNAVRENLISNHSISSDKIFVVNEFIVDKKEPLNKSHSGEFIVGGCGTLIHRKGFDLFLQAANSIVNKKGINDIHFLWIGGDKQSLAYIEFMREIELLNLQKHITITGETNETEKYYSQMSLFLMTSREDPFPLVNLEAAQHALPIICFDKSGGSPEFVTEDVGFVVPFIDTVAMADKILELKNNKALLQKFSDNIKQKSLEFTVENKAPELYNLIMQNEQSNKIV